MVNRAKLKSVFSALLVWLCLILNQSIVAQDERFQFINFNENDGLADVFVYASAQSNDGRMWFGTGSGLYVYNGNEFQSIKSPLDKPNAQIGNILERVFISSKQQVYLSSLNSFQLYDVSEEAFVNMSTGDAAELVKMGITHFSESESSEIWIATRNGFCGTFDPKTHKFNRLTRKDGLKDAASLACFSIVHDGKRVYVLTENGIVVHNTESGHQETIFAPANLGQLTRGLLDKKRNCIWLSSTQRGIVKLDLATKKIVALASQSDRTVTSQSVNLAWKNDREIWLGGNGLAFFNILSNKIHFVEAKYEDENSFKSFKIQQLFVDDAKNLWICSHFGLSLLPLSNQQIQNIALLNPVNGFLMEPYETVRSKNGDYLIAAGACNGIIRVSSPANTPTVIPLPGRSADDMHGSWCIFQSESNRIFIGATGGLFEYIESEKSMRKISLSDEFGHEIDGVRKIVGRGNSIYFQASNPGMFCYNFQTKELKHVYKSSGNAFTQNYSMEMTQPQCVDKSGNVWIILKEGVCVYHPTSNESNFFSTYLDDGTNIPLGVISGISQDRYGTMWFSSINNGVYQLKMGANKSIKNFNKQNTLLFPSDYCFRIQADKFGYVWIATLSGLVRMDAKSGKVLSILKKKNGLYKTNVDVGISMIDDKILIINNFGALSILSTDELKSGRLHPKITNLDIAGTAVDLKKRTFEVDHLQNFLRITWKSGSYGRRKQVLFAYRLKNANETWQYTTETSSNFVGLRPGDYLFEVKAQNEFGNWSSIDAVRIVIHPPFYQTRWFILLTIFVIGSLILLVYRFNIARIKRQAREKNVLTKQVAEIELKALRAQMNPHFVFNSLNSIQKFVLKNDPFTTSLYLTKFSRLIRLILENSNESHHSIGKEVEQIQLYLEIEQLRFENKFTFELKVNPSLRQDFTKIPSMIVQPYIENAIWHGLLHKTEQGKLAVSISKFGNDCVKIVVEDNGVGRAASAKMKEHQVVQKQSLGMQITEDRISLLNKLGRNKAKVEITDLRDEDGTALGTRVELIIEIN